ncbi:12919_t:CDS:1, partial [Ambispora leptoticha]
MATIEFDDGNEISLQHLDNICRWLNDHSTDNIVRRELYDYQHNVYLVSIFDPWDIQEALFEYNNFVKNGLAQRER